ncbi:MAG: hypothetical protein IKR13_04320, partial [Victivallales bacterium]|nr:hypothetical protein [Victivallales bacterium]
GFMKSNLLKDQDFVPGDMSKTNSTTRIRIPTSYLLSTNAITQATPAGIRWVAIYPDSLSTQ